MFVKSHDYSFTTLYTTTHTTHTLAQHMMTHQFSSIVIQVPAKMYDECLKDIMTSDPEALDQLLKRKCYELG